MGCRRGLGANLDRHSLGLSLTDTLDDLINEGRIEPQLAMKILSTFDKVITEVLADKVRARLTFKVRPVLTSYTGTSARRGTWSRHERNRLTNPVLSSRDISIHTDSVTKSGHS